MVLRVSGCNSMAGVVEAARLLRVLLRLFVRRFLGIGSEYSEKKRRL